MPAVVCVKCQKFLRVKKNGVGVEEGMPIRQADGKDLWEPYKLWGADLYECPGCGFQAITGFARQPIAEHYQENYERQKQAYSSVVRVNDCQGVRP